MRRFEMCAALPHFGEIASLLLRFAILALLPGVAHGQWSLRVVVVEGGGAIHNISGGEPMSPRVRVTDFAGRPIPFAAVTFTLPATGPGGTVAGGWRVSVASDENGEAAVPALRLNREVGAWSIRVEVSCRGRTGSATIGQISAAPVEAYLGKGSATVAQR